jgi:hypothetical protein
VVLERRGSGAEAGARARAGDGRSGVEVGEAGSRPEADACLRERPAKETHERGTPMRCIPVRCMPMRGHDSHASIR